MEVVKREILVVPMHNKAVNNVLWGYFSCSVHATHTLEDVNAKLYGM